MKKVNNKQVKARYTFLAEPIDYRLPNEVVYCRTKKEAEEWFKLCKKDQKYIVLSIYDNVKKTVIKELIV